MIQSPKTYNTLKSLGVINTIEEEEFNSILDLANILFDTSISFISLRDEELHHVKAKRGIVKHCFEQSELELAAEEVFVEDVKNFDSISLQIDGESIGSFFSFPLIWEDLHVGNLVFIDSQPRQISSKVQKSLRLIGVQCEQLIQKRIYEAKLFAKANEHQSLEDVLDASRIGTWIWNVQSGEVTFNDWWFEIVGYKRCELSPVSINTWYELVHPEDRIISEEALQKCFNREEEYYNVELRMCHKNGQDVWIHDRGKVVEWTHDGKPLIMSGTHIEITERKKNEVLYKAITDNVPGVVFRYILRPDNTDGVQLINEGYVDVWGFTAEEVTADLSIIWSRIDKADVERVQKSIEKSRETMNYWMDEWRYHHPVKNKVIWARGAGKPMKMEDGSTAWDTFIQDVSEAKEAEIRLKESEKLLKEAQTYSKMGNWNFDFLKNELLWSDTLYQVFGVDDKQFKETHGSFLSLIIPQDREYAKRASLHTQETGEPFNVKYRIITPAGESKVIEEYGFAEKDANGKVVRLFGTAQDVTEIMEIKRDLQVNTYITQINERQRIAQVIHDSLQQSLIATLMNLNSLDSEIMVDRNHKILMNAKELLKESVEQARSIAHDLVPPDIASYGLSNAIHKLVKKYADTDFQISFESYLSDYQQIPIDTEIGLYLIAQEGISNIVKHSQASKSYIKLEQINEIIRLTVKDNGVGIEPEKLENGNFGINGISNRVANIGGTMKIQSVPNKETILEVNIPFGGL